MRLQLVEEKTAVASGGRPETTEKDTDWLAPAIRVAVMELATESSWVTDLLPSLEREKSKGGGGGGGAVTVNELLQA